MLSLLLVFVVVDDMFYEKYENSGLNPLSIIEMYPHRAALNASRAGKTRFSYKPDNAHSQLLNYLS